MTDWQKTQDGEVLKTKTLVLIVNARRGGGWEARVCNTGRYSILASWPHPLTGHVNDAKRACMRMARDVLREEKEWLGRVEVE